MHDALAGKVLQRSDFRVPKYATVDLSGRTVLEVVPHGKHMLTRVEGGVSVHTHFEMDGSWHLFPHGMPWRSGGPAWQIRLVLSVEETDAVGYRLPVIDVGATSEESQWVGHLGPDVLSPSYDPDLALSNLLADPTREIGTALLDQRIVCGPGNLYRTEALFLAGLWPWTPVAEVPDPAGLLERERALMMHNRGHAWQSTTGSTRRGEQHWVFQRGGRPCRRCGTIISRGSQGDPGFERDTVWCPRCQPGR
jgi:endonuclease-8